MYYLRLYVRCVLLFGCIIFAPAAAIAQGLIDEPLPAAWQKEAALRDVHFVDARHGWAVGDHGVILKTIDGGEHWNAVADVNRSMVDWDHAAGQLSLREKLRGVQDRQIQSATFTSKSRSSKVSCQLNSVFFLNARLGWAAGGYAVPLLNRTRSVILKTVDGGIHWKVIANTLPPAIQQIEFSDPNTGWAIGDASASFTAGIFFTHDGGQTWQSRPLANRQHRHRWVAASGIKKPGQRLIGISTSGQLKFSEGNQVDNAAVLAQSKQHFYDLVMTDALNGWAVGALGAIFQTRDQGLSWQAPARLQNDPLPIDQIDFLSITATKTKVWAAGRPGGCLVSVDKRTGETHLHKTPITSAIHRIFFLDENRGWAVGDLGMVIATVDRGESWQIQRGTQTRIGLLSVCFDESELPLELLAQYACEDDVLCGAIGMSEISTHLHQSAGRCGNALFHQLNLPDLAKDADAWLQQAAVVRRLVTVLRTIRPSCVVLNPSIEQSVAQILDREKLLQIAIHRAADADFEADRYGAIELKPWQVDRMAIADIAGSMSVGGDKFLPQLAATVNDRIFTSRCLLGLDLPNSRRSTFRVVRFLGRGAGGQSTTVVPLDSDLMTGLHAVPRRTKAQHPPGDLTVLGRRNEKREAFKRILQADVNDAASMSNWKNEMLSLMLLVDRRTAGNWLLELADRSFAQNKPELAAKTMDFFAQRIPEHAFAPAALLWLAAYHASDDYSRRAFSKSIQRKAFTPTATVAAATSAVETTAPVPPLTALQIDRQQSGDQRLTWSVPDENSLKRQIDDTRKRRLSNDQVAYNEAEKKLFELGDALAGKVRSAADAVPAAAQNDNQRSQVLQATSVQAISAVQVPIAWTPFISGRRQRAARDLARLRGRDPDLALDEQTVAVELALLKNSQQKEQSLARLNQLLKSTPELKSEIQNTIAWLGNDPPQITAEDVLCSIATKKPKLDGKFDDDLWRSAFKKKAFRQMENTDVVFLARDHEFLYLIARINKQVRYNYVHQPKPRVRDANLSNRDRIEILLDCDRDGRSQFKLVLDHRGWVNESFDALTDWNPQWYVSRSQDEASWTVEAAMPLSDLRFGGGAESDRTTIEFSKPWSIKLNRFIYEKSVWNDAAAPSDGRSMLDLITARFNGTLLVFE